MEINNVFSPVPFYANKRYWHSNKWYTYGQKCPIMTTADKTLPFQLVVSPGVTLSSFTIKKADNEASVMTVNTAGNYFSIDAEAYSIIQVKACAIGTLPYGNYYYALTLSDGSTYISDIIAVISDMSKCIKITYKNVENLYFSSGHIDFTNDFVFELYLPTTIGKPEYEYEEELTKRLGYKFVESQVVNKVYKFTFPATEQLCDAYRFVRMCDYIRIDTYNPDFSDYDHYNVIYLSSEVEWLDNGDIASVETSFETDSIVQKLQDYSRTQLVNFYNALLSNSDEALKFDDETIAQYYNNYLQSIDGKMIRQLDAVSSISDNTVIAIDENEGAGAANKILLKPLLVNTVAEQLRASEVLTNFQQHINNSSIHITVDEKAILSLFGVDDNGDVYVKGDKGFYTNSFISAKGKSSSAGGGGSASALYQLVDVLANSTNDGVQGATTNSVLMYNGTKWYAGTIDAGLDEAALKAYLDANKYTTTTYVDSQLDTKADKTALSTYLPLSGGTMTGVLAASTNAGTNGGILLGTTYLTSISGSTIFYKNNAIRFGTSNTWSYNDWAGLKYNTSEKTIYLGVPDNSIFAGSATTGVIKTPGISTIYVGNTNYVYHTGNLAGDNAWITLSSNTISHKTIHANNIILIASSGQFVTGYTVDKAGHVTSISQRALNASDIPNIAITKVIGLQDALDKKVDTAFFARVFGLLDADGNEIAVNDVATVADSIKAKFGLWTEQYISAKGKNSSAGGGGSVSALYQLVDVLANSTNDGVLNAANGSVLMYNGTKWYAGAIDAGLDEAALKAYLDANKYTTTIYVDSKLDTKADKTALNAYATLTYVNDELAGTNSTVSTLTEKVNNFLEGTDTDGIINKWKELEAFLAGQTQTSTLADLLNVKAFASTKIIAGTGLTGGGDLTADITLSLATSGVTAGTYPKVTVDKYGRVTAGASLSASDIPNLSWNKITSDKPTTLSGYGITDGVNSVNVSGSGNAVTAASVSGHVLTLTKGVTFLPQSTFDDLFEKVLLEDGKTYAIRAKYGFYSDSFVSSKGLNSSSSGGGSASALYQLVDVLANSTNDGVLNATNGSVLMYNGTKWYAGNVVTDISPLTLKVNGSNLFTYDGKSSITTNLTVPTKVSQLTNDTGFITSISSSMVTSALGYTPYNSTNPNGYISGITKAMVEGVLTGNITSHTHSYLPLSGGAVTGTLNAPQFSAQSGGIYTNYRLYLPESASSMGSTTRPRFGRFDRTAGSAVLQLGASNLFDIVESAGSISLLRVSSNEFTYKNTSISLDGHTHPYLPLAGGTMTGSIKFNTNSLPQKTLSYVCGIDAFANGGEMGWMGGSSFVAQFAPTLTGTGASGTWGISITGNAATATALTTSAGSATLPIYFSSGKPVACTASSVFSNLSNSGNSLSVTVAGQNRTLTINYASNAGNADKLDGYHLTSTSSSYVNPWNTVPVIKSDGVMEIGRYLDFHFDNTSNLDYSCRLQTDSNSQNVVRLPSASGTLALVEGSVAYATSAGNADTLDGLHYTSFLRNFYTEKDLNELTESGVYRLSRINANNPYAYSQLLVLHGGGDTIGQLVMSYSSSGRMQVRSGNPSQVGGTGSWGAWNTVAFTTDNVASATKLQTARTLWGQSFDGTANVSGSLSNTGTITASAAATYDIGSNSLDYRYGYFQWIGAKSNTNLRLAANNSDNQIVLHINGNVGIGTGTNSPLVKLHVIGDIAATGAVTAKASSSDIRLKTDITDYKALSIIRSHRSIKYHWNAVAKANADIFNDDYWHYGLIAQDVQKDMPQMVSDVFKDYLVINYERLIPICWKGLQEVDDEVTKLKKKVRKLEMEIRELKQKEDRL